MKISGFTMAKNADKLYYPIKASIESILPICDEFVIALGDNDNDDNTLQEIESINSPKIRIIRTVWDIEKYPRGMENAHQTNIAKEACTGDWLFYVQADEVVHEKYLDTITETCKTYLNMPEVEGFLFRYKHFFGDYDHYIKSYGWYQHEIRIVRNTKDIISFASAQSFRKCPNFNGLDYRDKTGTSSLNVIAIDAEIYHYGWVRPPELMQKKKKSLDTIHKGQQTVNELYKTQADYFEYGDLNKLDKFTDTHPSVLSVWIKKFNWKDKLTYGKHIELNRKKMKHERLKSKLITLTERYLFFGKNVFGYSNWNILKPKKTLK